MKNSLSGLIVVLIAASWTGAVYAQPPSGLLVKELDPKTVLAWRDAGAGVGWYHPYEMGVKRFSNILPRDNTGMPAFIWYPGERVSVAKLPVPTEPFALKIEGGQMDDGVVKDLTRFTTMRACTLILADVTDAGFKELTLLKELRSLELIHTRVTVILCPTYEPWKSCSILTWGAQTSPTQLSRKWGR